jgi:hypothetical protein
MPRRLSSAKPSIAHQAIDQVAAPRPPAPAGHPFDAEIEAERVGWTELLALIRSVDESDVVEPGYFSDPEWSIADLVAHLGTWLAEAGVQLRRIQSGTYEPREIHIDAMNAAFRAAMSGQPWGVIFTQAQASRSRMLNVWYSLTEHSDAAAWWVAKAGADHYNEHLGRLREWVAELHGRREAPLAHGRAATARTGRR